MSHTSTLVVKGREMNGFTSSFYGLSLNVEELQVLSILSLPSQAVILERSGPEQHTGHYHPLLYEHEMRSGFCESKKIIK